MKDETEYPFQLALSHNEMVALVKWHSAEIRKVPKQLGSIALKMREARVGARQMKEIHNRAQDVIDFHVARAKGIMSLLEAAKQPGRKK